MSDSKTDSKTSHLDNMDDLPEGWVQQYDPKSDHPFWVDTKAKPPRSIWVHPFEDEQFMNEHPEIRDRHRSGSKPDKEEGKTGKAGKSKDKDVPQPAPGEAPPPYSPRRHSFTGEPSQRRRRDEEMHGDETVQQPKTPQPSSSKGKGKEKEKRGFFGKVKDKAIGTKEEREEARRREMIAAQRYAEQRRQQRRANPYYDDYYGSGSSSRYGGYSSSQGPAPAPFGPAMYNPPAGNPYYGSGYGNGYSNYGGYGGGYGGRSSSPHVLILHSPDLQDVLDSHNLPPLPQILQSFSPLQQITTRTTSLASIPLSTFALRFSDLVDIESAIHEDEEQRAERTMDWIGNRVQPRCAAWVETVEAASDAGDGPWKDRTPWWEEVKRCVESDHVPNRSEGWNHPVAMSTAAVNPLQALQDLHSRAIDFPPWVDVTFLRYSLILHPSNSSLSDPIAESLFNAVKKQYGLHTYLLPLSLPTSPPPTAVSIPLPVPRLPPIPPAEISPMPPSQPAPAGVSTSPPPASVLSPRVQSPVQSPDKPPLDATKPLLLSEGDAQQLSRFTREFVTMSLIPWMEKAVVDWNELYSTSRRLPSRLFSSTRRLFGSGYSSATSTPPPSTPSHGSSPSISSISSRVNSHAPNSSISSLTSVTSTGGGQAAVLVSQQRRLAEFATILGDFKLAISVWENLRKESKGGHDILPLLLAPSPALPLLASNSVQANHTQFHELPAQAQMRSLVNAVRWDIGMDQREFLGNVLEGERWLVYAAGAAEEVPTALLLAHAAFLSAKKDARRRSALWYLRAADRLEKAGIKPLAMYFFRRSHSLYRALRPSDLSPSFWESEGKSRSNWRGFDAVLPGIEHELGRLLYTTGDTAGAVQFFLGLLQDSDTAALTPLTEGLGITINGASQDAKQAGTDKVYLEDFRVALKHFKATESERFSSLELQLQPRFCQIKHTRIRLPGDALNGDADEWKTREDDWAAFWKPKGGEKLHMGGRAAVDETFWVDLAIRNPLEVDVTLSALTILLRDASSPETSDRLDFVEVEVVDDIQLGSREARTIPIGIRSSRPASLVLTHITYNFLGLLPAKETLATRGRRLQDTPQQRQNKVYAPDIMLNVQVEDALQRVQANFVDDRHLLLAEGECKRMTVKLLNSGKNPISELWIIGGPEDELWVDDDKSPGPSAQITPSEPEFMTSTNSLAPREPHRVLIENLHSSSTLESGESVDLSLILHTTLAGEHNLCLLLAYREASGQAFYSTRLVRQYEVRPILTVTPSVQPFQTSEHEYVIDLSVVNKTTSSSIRITQATMMSQSWTTIPLTTNIIGALPPSQVARGKFAANRWEDGPNVQGTREFVIRKLRSVLQGSTVEPSDPPTTRLQCRHLSTSDSVQSINSPAIREFIHAGRRNHVSRHISKGHPHIPQTQHRSVFPLYNPTSLDFVVFWEIPSQDRRGHVLIPISHLGAEHAPLAQVLDDVENTKAKRSMYAETRRERMELIQAIKNSEWNAETDPIGINVMGGITLSHDFASSPCHVPVTFVLRNHSLTNPARYTLTLPARSLPGSSTHSLPHFIGRLTHRGELAPSQAVTVRSKLLVSQPGSHEIGGWSVETEVGEITDPPRWITRQRYKQELSDTNLLHINVENSSRT
ncbi:hypothetical protein EIP91_006412 [Steccherinum ochraceum]|uniref:TPPC8 first Ig-like domain-containing protein n=1 Tax=Steccherinum ochraceum TaxID=92696 RepID=A0A4R0RGH4_9APHY|nr:hypothetical protein EIP91_006412 [Steccherinum ochraceum]